MNCCEECVATNHDLGQIEVGVTASLGAFRQALKTISMNGRRWWIVTDPSNAEQSGYMEVGHENQNISDLLSKIYFRLPVLSESLPRAGTDRFVILLSASYCILHRPGLYVADDGQIKHDALEDFASFFYPLKEALIQQMQACG